jgi:hypothetical protein
MDKHDELESAIVGAAISALDKRAAALRRQAALEITTVDNDHVKTTIVSSEARAALTLAEDFNSIARDLEAEVRS